MRRKTALKLITLFLFSSFITILYLKSGFESSHEADNETADENKKSTKAREKKTTTGKLYELQQSYLKYSKDSTEYRIAAISDKDKASKVKKDDGKLSWESDLMLGTLRRNPYSGRYSVEFDEGAPITLRSKLNEAGRAMELSELLYFNNKLFAFDDRTGVVSEIDIENKLAIPTYILMEGDGRTEKGQKTEWATVKDGAMYVGSIGKEWTTPKGEIVNFNNQWIKRIDAEGRVTSLNWHDVYESMRKATNTSLPGYLVHEAACFNPMDRKWYFMPRRESREVYDDEKDEERGSNLVIVMDENLKKISSMRVGDLNPQHGFSSCKFLPYREGEFVALKSMEYKDIIKTFITVMNVKGEVLLPETEFATAKYEGVEFI